MMKKMLIPVAIATIVAVALLYAFLGRDSLQFNDTCAGINRTPERNVCYVDLAISLNLTQPCNHIAGNDNLLNACYSKTSIMMVNRLGCNEIKDSQARSYCQAKIAAIRKEAPICENIDDPDWRDTCYNDVAEATNKTVLCGRIARTSTADICYDTLAKNTNYAVNCAYIKDLTKRDQCFVSIAVSTMNADTCQEILVRESGWTCFMRVAKAAKNPDVCGYIDLPAISENCRRAVNETIASEETTET